MALDLPNTGEADNLGELIFITVNLETLVHFRATQVKTTLSQAGQRNLK